MRVSKRASTLHPLQSVREMVAFALVSSALVSLSACAGTTNKKTESQWIEDCVYERTIPRDQCQDMWRAEHSKK